MAGTADASAGKRRTVSRRPERIDDHEGLEPLANEADVAEDQDIGEWIARCEQETSQGQTGVTTEDRKLL